MRKRDIQYHEARIKRDIIIIVLSVVVAVLFATSDLFEFIYSVTENVKFLEILISGALFTSIFTTPISIAAFLHLADSTNLWYMALVGGAGAVLGDLIIFMFIKDNLGEDINYVLSAPRYRKIRSIFKFRIFRWLVPLVGALVIASPLPDELGLAMMGLSKMRLAVFIPISFVMNVIGIYLIGLAAQAF